MRRDDPKDSNKRYFRSDDRIFRLNEVWYFCAREGEQGPFGTHALAVEAKQRYATDREELLAFQSSRKVSRPGPATRTRVLENVDVSNLALDLEIVY